ncbi:MAG TPA: pitrilysin family protein [Candidatus Paceibacterota bacterium]|nr:pitrilysin family protein [Candidatus Paceibacterota bacterium]
MQKPKKKTYKNGLRVVTIPMKDNPTVTVLVLVGTGTDYESKDINGISHFLEHMCFKGTVKRPTPQSISHELDSLGCQYNAFTSHEMTGYYAKGDSKNFSKIFDIVSDIYLNSTFQNGELQKEKGVIIEEINMYEDMPASHVQDLFDRVLYGDQPAGWSVLGLKENILKMTRDDFENYKNSHYSAHNTVVIVAGDITNEKVYKEVDKYFNNLHNIKSVKKIKTKDSQTEPKVLIKYKETDQTHFVLGVRTFPILDKKNTTLSLLSGVLGAGMSSRLFVKLREEMGVAYYVRAQNNPSIDYGSLQISAGVNNIRVKEVLVEILKECDNLIKNKVSEKELEKVKSYLIGNMKMSVEATDDVATFYGSQELMKNDVKTLEDKIKEIKKIKVEDIQKMAKTIFKKEHLNLAIIGPFKNEKEFNEILKF